MRALACLLVLGVVGCSGSDDANSEPTPDDTGAVIEETATADSGLIGEDSSTAEEASIDAPAPTDTGTVADGGLVGSAGCGKTATPGVTKPTIMVGTLARTYVLSIPAGYDPKKPLPLLFAWHGRTGSGTAFRSGGDSYGGSVEQAAAGKAIFVYPDGLPVTSDPKDTGWVDTDPKGRDFAFFDALLADVSSKLCVDRKRVFSYGHSFGAFMTNALGCHRSTVLRGLGPFAGGPSSSWSKDGGCDKTPIATWIQNDKDDPTVIYTSVGIPGRDHYVKLNGCDATKTTPVSPSPCVAYSGCGAPLHWCASSGVGHGWPSFGGTGLWNFFSAL